MSRLGVPLSSLLHGPGARMLCDWRALLSAWHRSAAGQALCAAVDARVAAGATVYPAQVFRAFSTTPLARTRVVILGQDPYHAPGQAEGLAFSVPPGVRVPPSLRNIQRELQRDLGLATAPGHGSLLPWAQQGVMLLNTVLTVEEGQAGSHARLGWQHLTDAACTALAQDAAPKVFMLWGAHAQARKMLIEAAAAASRHLLLTCNHPSPLSALRAPLPFIGCGHFSAANRFLSHNGRAQVDWCIP